MVNLFGVMTGLVGALGIVGIPLLVVDALDTRALLGNLMIIASNVFFVAGAIISKQLLKSYSPLALVGAIFLVGAITFLPLAVMQWIQNPGWV